MKAKPPTLTLAGWEHIASAADSVRLPTKCVVTEPQQADHGPSGPGNRGNVGLLDRDILYSSKQHPIGRQWQAEVLQKKGRRE